MFLTISLSLSIGVASTSGDLDTNKEKSSAASASHLTAASLGSAKSTPKTKTHRTSGGSAVTAPSIEGGNNSHNIAITTATTNKSSSLIRASLLAETQPVRLKYKPRKLTNAKKNQKVVREMPKQPLDPVKKKLERNDATTAKRASRKESKLAARRLQNLSEHSSVSNHVPTTVVMTTPTQQQSTDNAEAFFAAKKDEIQQSVSQSIAHVEDGGVYRGEGPQEYFNDEDDHDSIQFSD